MRGGFAKKSLITATIAAFVSIAPPALAQQPDARAKAEAQKLYQDGAKDMETEAYSRACPKFEAAWKILPDHMRTGLTLASCFDKWGKPASALNVLEKVAVLAKDKGDKKKIAEVEESIADLDKRVPRLTIRVPEDIATMPGFTLSRAGIPMPPASWGSPVPLDPGEYEIEATAVDRPAWKKNVQLSAGASETVEITPNWEKPKSKVVYVTTPSSAPSWPKRARVIGFVGLGLGAVGLGTWGVLGGLAIAKNNASKGHCLPDDTCDPEGFQRRTDAVNLGHGATVGLIAGGVLAAAGISLVVVSASANKEKKPDRALTLTNVWVSPTGASLRAVW